MEARERMLRWTDVMRDYAINCTASQLCAMLGTELPPRVARLLDLVFTSNNGKIDLPPYGLTGVPRDVVDRAKRAAFPEHHEVACTSTGS